MPACYAVGAPEMLYAKSDAMNNFKWSEGEKKIARRVFDAALAKECAALLAKVKDLAVKAQSADDVWAIHDYLAQQRKTIDAKYDYRYSQLVMVFGRLLRERLIEDRDLTGLREDKLSAIRYMAEL
jgi:hypothetical protein